MFIVAVLISIISATSSLAQPGDFQAMNPNRDVLNGGALTPAGRIGLEPLGGAAGVFGPNTTYAKMGGANPSAPGAIASTKAIRMMCAAFLSWVGWYRVPIEMVSRKSESIVRAVTHERQSGGGNPIRRSSAA